MTVTRREIAAAVRGPLSRGALSREQLVAAAAAEGARSDVRELLAQLPDHRYGRLTDLWPALPDVPVGS